MTIRARLLTTVTAAACVSGCAAERIGHAPRSIVGGELTPEGMFPATGALVDRIGFACTGVLVAPDVVLTAAHCLDSSFLGDQIPGFTLAHDANARDITVVPGLSRHQLIGFDVNIPVRDGVAQFRDLGVVLLAQPIEGIEYAVLPTADEMARLAVDATVQVTGYGVTDANSRQTGVKHHGTAKVVDVGEFELLISEPGEQQQCIGDSGGPTFAELGGTRLVGITSRDHDTTPPFCDRGAVNTRVDAYYDFIFETAPQIPCGGPKGPCGLPHGQGGDGGLEPSGDDEPQDGGCVAVATPSSAGWMLAALVLVRRRRASC